MRRVASAGGLQRVAEKPVAGPPSPFERQQGGVHEVSETRDRPFGPLAPKKSVKKAAIRLR